jgi:UDP-2-acetamido-2,6-beta-L-arabino-hexul-4-ose reductase
VTGAAGFIGRNLVVALRRAGVEVCGLDLDGGAPALQAGVRDAAVVFHLAGTNRPARDDDFHAGNVGSLEQLLSAIDDARAAGPSAVRLIVLSSSTQAELDNPYGRSKAAAEQLLAAYAARTGVAAAIYRLPGVFGRWCRPHYNSVVATFCHDIARDLPISISDPAKALRLVHVDDVVASFRAEMERRAGGTRCVEVRPVFEVLLGDLAARLRAFRDMRRTLEVPDVADAFSRRLFGTYMSYLPTGEYDYALQVRTDGRGALAELLKSAHFGQLFVSRTRPGVTRGNHYHDLKVEKFCVLEGDAVVRFRPIEGTDVSEYRISGTDFRVIDIPPGVTHSIQNVGATEMVVLFWASEVFDASNPDTHSSEVIRD